MWDMMRVSVKTILIASLLLASLVSGFSQTQEVKLIDRIMKPDTALGNPLQSKSFSGSSSGPVRSSMAATQKFQGLKDVTTKEFAFTRTFLGLKNPWFGSKVFATKGAGSMSKYEVKKAGLEKTSDVGAYYAATKSANFGSPVVPVSSFVPQAAAQRISDKINQKMTIDEVREMLNKAH